MTAGAATPPIVLTIAGFDPTSGAGLSADIKTVAANGAYGVACMTAITVQNSRGVRSYAPLAPALLEEQLDCLLDDVRPRAVKIGMLGSKETVEVVARHLERLACRWVVLDPVRLASDGSPLSDDPGWNAMRHRLLPLCNVLTPNLHEAEQLTGLTVAKLGDLEGAARALHALGPNYVVVKGGHLDKPVDLLFDGSSVTSFVGDRVRNPNTHGTGCTFSAALAANLALGKQVADAVLQSKAYLTAALKFSYPVGEGRGGLNHLYRLQDPPSSRNIDPAPLAEFTTR